MTQKDNKLKIKQYSDKSTKMKVLLLLKMIKNFNLFQKKHVQHWANWYTHMKCQLIKKTKEKCIPIWYLLIGNNIQMEILLNRASI